MILHETKSGPIEIVRMGIAIVLQFNCNCDDAIPFCDAMCCRMRPMYNARIKDDEVNKFAFVQIGNIKVVERKDTNCFYLEGARCGVHADKPQDCSSWHCSPKGNPGDDTIKRRDIGWQLVPIGASNES